MLINNRCENCGNNQVFHRFGKIQALYCGKCGKRIPVKGDVFEQLKVDEQKELV